MKKYDIGLVGLSVMGRSLALNMADHGFSVAGYNRSRKVTEQVVKDHPHKNMDPFYDLGEMVQALARPRKVMVMIKAGDPVDLVLKQLVDLLEEGDMVLDGGNSYFGDTRRREAMLKAKGIHYFGVGVSGGEEGARFGPSIMPGGDKEAYQAISPILEAIAAKATDGAPCCAYMGPDGAGHYVKMVHNGIEYADMQLIAEAYLLLKEVGGFDNHQIGDIFHEWNQGELRSYLIGITAEIFKEVDDLAEGDLIDHVLDSAGQKGTGKWASMEALSQGVDISMITAAYHARITSNRMEERKLAKTLVEGPKALAAQDPQKLADLVRDGLYVGKMVAYAQGFSLMADASKQYGWNLDLGKVASIFRAGCIIQAHFLNDITRAFQANPQLDNLLLDGFFLGQVNQKQDSLRKAASLGIQAGTPIPAMAGAVSYLDGFRGVPVGASLIQAQRDYFGAHTYQRNDMEGIFHHQWAKDKK